MSSAFDFREKDDVIDAIVELSEVEQSRGKTKQETVASILEAVTYGINQVLSEQK
jgi:hypothetical protein